MIRGIVFDLDGVLIDTEPLHVEAVREAFGKQGVALTAEQLSSVVARNPRDYLPALCDEAGVSDMQSVVETIDLAYDRLWASHVALMPHAREVLQQLHSRGTLIALASSSERELVDRFLDTFKVRDYFYATVSSDDVTTRKPHPEPYQKAAAALGIPTETIIAVEDSALGVTSAHAAGLRVYAVPTPLTRNQDFSKATRVLDTLLAVLKL